ncbi:MAG: GHKL domain-containing protein [Flavobacteriales bacterium]|nr:GHKL domain-containing protein [Flavobacteriales bacterium]
MLRPLLLLLIGVLLGALAWLVQEPDADALLKKEAGRIQRILDRQAALLDANAAKRAHELAELGPEEWMHHYGLELEREQQRNGTVYMGFKGDSLVCWSGQLRAKAVLDGSSGSPAQCTLPSGIYQHAVSSIGLLRMHALVPVWNTPPVENLYLERGFQATLNAPKKLAALPTNSTGPLLYDANGTPLLRLAWRDGSVDVGSWILWKLTLMLACALAILLALWAACERLVHRGSPLLGIATFMVLLFLLRWAVLAFVPAAPFDRLPLFDPATYATSFAFPSLGDLFMNATLLAIGMGFMNRQIRGHSNGRQNVPIAIMVWAATLTSAAWVTQMIIGLVNDSSVDLDLFHVQRLNFASGVGLAGIAIIFGAWLLLVDAGVHLLRGRAFRKTNWWIGTIAISISILVHHHFGIRDTLLFLWPVPLVLLLFHMNGTRARFVHVLIGLSVLSIITAHVLTKYTHAREHRERLVLAERLSVREDPVVELLFREVAPELRSDPELYALITSNTPCNVGELDAAVRQSHFGGYWDRYDVRVFAYDAEGIPRCSSEGNVPRSLVEEHPTYVDHAAVVDMPELFFDQGGVEGPYYHARVAVMARENSAPGQLIIELHPRSVTQSLGFPELLLAGDDQLTRRTDQYALARYEQSILVDRSNAPGIPLHWKRDLGNDGTAWFVDGGFEYLAKGSEKGTLLVLGLPLPGLVDRATTFSYLFALFSAILALVLLLRTLWVVRGLPPMGIAAKVRTALLLFAVVGLLVFAYGAQHLLTTQYAQRIEAKGLEKARSAHVELQQRLDGRSALTSERSRYLEHLLAQLSNVLFTDIALYDLHGRLLASSRPQIFSAGLLGPRMDAVAYAKIVIGQAGSFVHQEAIGTATYQSAYLPLQDRKGTVLGYLALPSFADQRQQELERADVLVTVVNLFVLFFALSVLVAVFISNWTTRPLDLLKQALGRVALGGTNKPIRYRGKDEVGQLVEVYNRKVEELRDSAEKLARSERETAWREMAQQVAHEIKNPLTPMKLSIQHFQRTWTPEAPDADQKLERFSTGLVQQIDALSGIANAFGDFARMPRAKPEDLDLGEVAEVALAVFTGTPNLQFTLEKKNNGPFLIHADREQLLRVFNNLLKNALQSVPDDRKAEIRVALAHDKSNVIVEIHDNGIGIAEADRERIFQPNFTTKSSGMGLGLAMVQRIVEAAGGTVSFTTEEEVGTTFIVALPLRT